MDTSILSLLYIFIGFSWWVVALTFGLPITVLLLLSKNFRSAFFSWVYANVAEPLQRTKVCIIRKKAFQILKDSLGDRNSLVPLEILEIGVGQGPNLQFYPKNCNLTALDKNKFFEKDFLRNRKKNPHVSYKKIVIQPAECMRGVDDNSFDVVVSTFLHCSCDDSVAVLQEVKRVLKPGGKYLFLDHTGFPEGDIGLHIQRFFNPLWSLIFDGCFLDRNPSKEIKDAGFSDVQLQKYISPSFRRYLLRHQILGIATK
ncbi:methyltransferase-like protein 7B [Nephila pilipes]|uniref:Methyltransferase-like protein 7B n=1 Tax=Nephila pilipes TaxID=299642 RepID=A0A8X6PA27_NEPPI|nr:methyltransferase-like protein 7B [Nephila pilipes]